MRPPDGAAFLMGLIIIAFKLALTFGFAWFVCLCGIIGFETVRTGASIVTAGLLGMAPHYYTAAMYMAFCLIGLILLIKQAFTIGLFGMSVYRYEEPTEEQKKEGEK